MESIYQFFTEAALRLHINLASYPLHEVLFLAVGFIGWAIAYHDVLKNIHRYKIVEIPIIVAALDIGWEFGYAFLLDNDFGPLFTWGCVLWFFMDLHINYHALKYSRKLVTNPWIKKYFAIIYVFVLVHGFFITYYMRTENEDDGLGLISAYFINILISSLYIYQLFCFPHYRNKGFSYRVAWAKFIGTAAISVVCFMHLPDNQYLHSMCTAVFIMDVLYIYLFKDYRPESRLVLTDAVLEHKAVN